MQINENARPSKAMDGIEPFYDDLAIYAAARAEISPAATMVIPEQKAPFAHPVIPEPTEAFFLATITFAHFFHLTYFSRIFWVLRGRFLSHYTLCHTAFQCEKAFCFIVILIGTTYLKCNRCWISMLHPSSCPN